MLSTAIIELMQLYERTKNSDSINLYAYAEQATEELPALKPDIALDDIQLTRGNDTAIVDFLHQHSSKPLCFICTAYDEAEKVFHVVEADANGYVLKIITPDHIEDAILNLINGGARRSGQATRKRLQTFKKNKSAAQSVNLTPRERQVLKLLARGLLYKEIALQLSISPETVRRHCFNIYEKLNVNNRTEALNKYFGKIITIPFILNYLLFFLN
jgi:DNA-binding NarL/FixJ family response regulator